MERLNPALEEILSSPRRLVPATTRWIPNRWSRQLSRERVRDYDSSQFETYADYFFFLHIDPVQRFWHSYGMFAGIGFFTGLFLNWNVWPLNLIFYLLGVLHFYGFGLISHLVYDGGSAKTEGRHFWDTMPTVIYFNTLTATFQYQKALKKFIRKYPFVIEAYGLRSQEKLQTVNESANVHT